MPDPNWNVIVRVDALSEKIDKQSRMIEAVSRDLYKYKDAFESLCATSGYVMAELDRRRIAPDLSKELIDKIRLVGEMLDSE
jgi:hypothetical protein